MAASLSVGPFHSQSRDLHRAPMEEKKQEKKGSAIGSAAIIKIILKH